MPGSTLRRRLRTLPARLRNWTPHPVLDTDVFLVSFPKAGNTWMRFMLAHVIVQLAQLNTSVNFRSIHQLVPDIHVEHIGRNAVFPPFPRIIKSHVGYNPAYPRVIYIVRDGRDVVISNYEALKREKTIGNDVSVKDVMHHPRYGIASWRDHVSGWLDAGLGERLMLLKYEDLVNDPATGLEHCVRFCGVEPQRQAIEKAVEASSFNNMRRIEEQESIYLGKTSPESRFVRRGQPGEWTEVFTPDDLKYFFQQTGTLLDRLGYDDALVQ